MPKHLVNYNYANAADHFGCDDLAHLTIDQSVNAAAPYPPPGLVRMWRNAISFCYPFVWSDNFDLFVSIDSMGTVSKMFGEKCANWL